jgi:hypothetical protein
MRAEVGVVCGIGDREVHQRLHRRSARKHR